MAAKQISGDGGLPSNLAGMSKNHLYEIMSQMKNLIEQNEQQARKILIQNPLLTKALFQAQIMLGMVQPPQPVPNIQPSASSIPPQPQPLAQSAAPSLPGQSGLPDQKAASQTQAPVRRQNPNQSPMTVSSASVPPPNVQSQPIASHPPPQQPRGPVNPISLSQSSQLPSVPSDIHHSTPQPPTLHQPHVPTASSHLQQPPLQTSGNSLMPLQPPLPPQPRHAPMANFQHQYAPPNMGYQHGPGGPQHISQHPGGPQHLSQPPYHSGAKPPSNMGPSYPQGQPPPRPSQQPQQMYHGGGSHIGTEFGNQGGGPTPMQVDRGSSWMNAQPENSMVPQHQGPPPPAPSQMGPSNPASITPEVEKQLLQQVMSLTPEQINLLPPEQRNQVFQLQQILRPR